MHSLVTHPSATHSSDPALVACRECDLLQREPSLAPGETARCIRCDAVLFRATRDGLDRCLALTIAAGILFVVANAFPIVFIDMQGRWTTTTLFGAVQSLYDQEMQFVAALVFATTMVIPALELLAMTWMLAPLKLGIRAPGIGPWFRWVEAARPWGMIEVFMLGVLVSLSKLSHIATVVPGIALWSFGALIVLLAAAATAFEPREFWTRVEQIS